MQSGRDVVIVDAVRTPIGRGSKSNGSLRSVHPAALLGRCFTEVLARARIDAEHVDDVAVGCALQIGPQQSNVGRVAWLQAGLPIEAPVMMVDRACGSGQQAANTAAALIAAGVNDVVVAGGVEKMSSVSFPESKSVKDLLGDAYTPQLLELYAMVGQGEGAERIADDWGLTRADLDELAVESHRRAALARESGAFVREIVPVATDDGIVDADQGIRPDTSVATLSALPTVFRTEEAGGRITAGSSSQISDGASALVLAERSWAETAGLTVRARVVDQITVGCDPVKMLEGPIPATAAILERTGRTIDDIDLFECNEAFAPVVLAWERAHKIDHELVNVRGGAIALGHPLGSSGARLLTTLLHALEDRDLTTGLVTMCCGGGFGIATLIERI